jgi:hypothetical protein
MGSASMTVKDITLQVIDALNAANIPHLLVGSFSSNYYGIPRSTEDADFVVQLDAASLTSLQRHLGPDFIAEPQMTFETMTGTHRQELRCLKSPFKVELFLLSNDPHDQSRWERRRPVEFSGHQTFLPAPEDVVIMKLRWARAKDLDDVRGVLAVQQPNLDWSYLESWCERHGTMVKLTQLRRSIPAV